MSQLLVSVNNLDEAELALNNNVDIIDLKSPANGALGALSLEEISKIAGYIKQQGDSRLITATVGDLPMQPDLLLQAVASVANTGVDIVKIGFFNVTDEPTKVYAVCLEALQNLVLTGKKFVAVLFAEYQYPSELLAMLRNAGFYGVMLDTAVKNGITLFDCLSQQQIQNFVERAQKLGLKTGLAGSLRYEHIAPVKQFDADYIGLRGGVCADGLRTKQLCTDRLNSVAKLFNNCCNSATTLSQPCN